MRIENPYTQFASERPLVWTSQCSRKLVSGTAGSVLSSSIESIVLKCKSAALQTCFIGYCKADERKQDQPIAE